MADTKNKGKNSGKEKTPSPSTGNTGTKSIKNRDKTKK